MKEVDSSSAFFSSPLRLSAVMVAVGGGVERKGFNGGWSEIPDGSALQGSLTALTRLQCRAPHQPHG